jgi:membrane protein YdbS with pleckstrin-like domain
MSEPAPATTEQTLWTGTVSNFHYLGKWLTAVILLIAVACSFLLPLPDLGLILWAARVALVVLALLLVGWIQLDRSRRRYAVTNKRVSVEYGIVNRNSNEVA